MDETQERYIYIFSENGEKKEQERQNIVFGNSRIMESGQKDT